MNFFCRSTMLLILTSKFLDLSSDPSIFFIYKNFIFLGYVQLNFSAVFEDALFCEKSEEFCHLKVHSKVWDNF